MYNQISIHYLRGVLNLSVNNLQRINLFVGQNNAGKTTLLEGVFLLGGATNPMSPATLGQLRGQRFGASPPDALWRPLFYQLNPRGRVQVEGTWEHDLGRRRLEIEALEVSSFADTPEDGDGVGGGLATAVDDFEIGGLRLRYIPTGGPAITTTALFDPRTGNIEARNQERPDFVRTIFLSARTYPSLVRDAQQFSYLLRIKQEAAVLEAVRLIEPAVQRIEVLSDQSGPSVYVDVGLESLIPLAVCGEGFVRLFSIAVELTASRGGVLLIDEIDNGLHHSVMPRLWALLRAFCARHQVQIFATTHNEELVVSAMDAFRDGSECLGLYRIDKLDSQHRVTAYDQQDQQAVLREGFEVRG